MGYRVVVDFDLCESNARCMEVAPTVFEVREDDVLYILDETPPDEVRAQVEEAVRRCPKAAISLAEE
jgi:ferredoxin